MSFAAGADVLSVAGVSAGECEALFAVAEDMRAIVERGGGGCALLSRRVLALAFFEPSTRTSCSFAAAMARLGGAVLPLPDGPASSAGGKGESLADTARALAAYADALVLRHPRVGAAAEAAAACACPVINGGDGVGEHPTQALLDAFCARAELPPRRAGAQGAQGAHERQGLAGAHFVLVGDLRNGRTVHSLARLLALWPGVRFTLVAPGAWRARSASAARARCTTPRPLPARRPYPRRPAPLQPSSPCPRTLSRR